MADVGRPPMYKTAEEIDAKAMEYFTWIKGEYKDVPAEQPDEPPVRHWIRLPEPPTITGLTLFLGFDSRQSFYDYCDKGDEFAYALKRHRTRIECQYEQNLHGTTPTGSIFALKNMGWKDRSEVAPVDPDGNALKQQLTIKIIRDTASSITPGDFTPKPAEGTESGEKV